MNKLKILWKNRRTWNYAFTEWQLIMFPHIHHPNCTDFEWLSKDNVYWFYQALNNYDGTFDD